MTILKTCPKCGVAKGLEHFHKSTQKYDGLYTYCKPCVKIKVALQNEKKIADGTWDQFIIRRNARCLARAKTRPIKRKAQDALNTKLKSGKIIKQQCEICGEKRVHGHHDDYSKPLEVRWLCSQHHVEWHSANGPGANGDPLASKLANKNNTTGEAK